MKGGQDLGGRQGLGPLHPEPEQSEPLFHADWERRVFAMTLATGMLGRWNIDESRFARENQHPVDYLKQSYYENWLAGLENLLQQKGLLSEEELAALPTIERRPTESELPAPGAFPEAKTLSVPNAADAEKLLARGGPTAMPEQAPPGYKVGDLVRVRRWQSAGHTRAPGYVQGCIGEVSSLRGCHVFPDASAQGERRGEQLYTVRFDGAELWGDEQAGHSVQVDLWEPYLEPR